MSAGELFDLIRPAVLIVSALVSTLVLAHARRHFPLFIAMPWALATLFFPLITLPLYLAVHFVRKRHSNKIASSRAHRAAPSWLVTTPFAYATVVLTLIGVYLYVDRQSVDAHLARAAQAKLKGEVGKSILEYRRALLDDDNPHTHKLLALELAESGNWTEALWEFRIAEDGGEPDDSIPFRIGTLLDILNLEGQARLEYERYLVTRACTDPVPDGRCVIARAKVEEPLD